MAAKEFDTHNLPDIQPNTRIIAICGINDSHDPEAEFGDASPRADGWFFSDFYAFNYLLKGLGHSQKWFTCLNPQYLVKTYGQYALGNPLKERRVVLDQSFLNNPDLRPHSLEIVKQDKLLSAFLDYLKKECRVARHEGQPVLVLIFGHGEEDTHNVYMPGDDLAALETPALTMEDFAKAIGTGVAVTTLMTSCYSGGWTVRANLNITAMTAAGRFNESESWPESKSVGKRFCSSIYASAVIESLFKLEESELPKDMNERQSRTYKEFEELVRDTLVQDVDRKAAVHDISFSAQDDAWAMEWKQRSGVPLNYYRSRWEALKTISNDDVTHPMMNRDPAMSREADENPLPRGRTGGSRSGIYRLVQQLARKYVNSYPGRDSLAKNHRLHGNVNRLIAGEVNPGGAEYTYNALHSIFTQLEYRLGVMERATNYRDICGLDFVACNDWSEDEWVLSKGKETLQKSKMIEEMMSEARILRCRSPGAGDPYMKGRRYLAAALTDSGPDRTAVGEKISLLRSCKPPYYHHKLFLPLEL